MVREVVSEIRRFTAKSILVVCAYRSQLNAIRLDLAQQMYDDVAVETVDCSQVNIFEL